MKTFKDHIYSRAITSKNNKLKEAKMLWIDESYADIGDNSILGSLSTVNNWGT